jgi:hypothetical protein
MKITQKAKCRIFYCGFSPFCLIPVKIEYRQFYVNRFLCIAISLHAVYCLKIKVLGHNSIVTIPWIDHKKMSGNVRKREIENF